MQIGSDQRHRRPHPDVVASFDREEVLLLVELLGVALAAARATQNMAIARQLDALLDKFDRIRWDLEEDEGASRH